MGWGFIIAAGEGDEKEHQSGDVSVMYGCLGEEIPSVYAEGF